MKYLILPFLFLVGCVINVDSTDNVEAAEENLLTAQQILDESNAIQEELLSFANAINEDKLPLVDIEDGFAALNIAHQIADKLKMLPSMVL